MTCISTATTSRRGSTGSGHGDDIHRARDRALPDRPPRGGRRPAATPTRTPLSPSRSILSTAPTGPLPPLVILRGASAVAAPARLRPRLRPALRPADPALVLSRRRCVGRRGDLPHRRAVRARRVASAGLSAPRSGSTRLGRWIAHAAPSRFSSSRLAIFIVTIIAGFRATRIPIGTSRRPWCGSSGGSASPMCVPSSEICGR